MTRGYQIFWAFVGWTVGGFVLMCCKSQHMAYGMLAGWVTATVIIGMVQDGTWKSQE